MTIDEFRSEVEASAEDAYSVMANQAQSDANEPFLIGLELNGEDNPEALGLAIDNGDLVTGWLRWMGGFRSPLEARLREGRVVTRFGPWEPEPSA